MIELMIPLLPQPGNPLYEQIYLYIKEEIHSGQLKAMDRLPSTRVLAKNLSISRSTTQMAYDQLQAEGYIEAVPHKGYYITHIQELTDIQCPQSVTKVPPDQCIQQPDERPLLDFSPSGIDIKSFPYSIWKKITKSILVDEKRAMFLAGDPQGELGLRETLCKYLHASRGVNCLPEQIVIGAGNEYLLMLLHFILGKKSIFAMEDPTYIKAYRILKSMDSTVVPVKMDQFGMDVKRLEQSQANIAYVMPSHQYPTGIVMPVKRRHELLSWANQHAGRYLIEDDYDSEFRYKGKPIPALQGMDQFDKVIYIGTFSRSIAPAIRVGYLVLPKSLLNCYREKVGFYSSTVSRIDQHILDQFIVNGYYERHLNRMRAVYRGKQEELLEALKPMAESFTIKGEDAGVHIMLTDKAGRTEKWLIEQAAKVGVKVYGLSQYLLELPTTAVTTVLLGFASLSSEQIIQGVRLLYRTWGEEESSLDGGSDEK